jgi:hypothetical protein
LRSDKASEKDKGGIFQKEFLQQIKDRSFTLEERAEISSRLDSLERDINRVW